MANADRVLVTGISGFIAKHVARGLLEAGFEVRGTVRSPAKADEVRAALGRSGRDDSGLQFAMADLDRDDGWDDAVRGVRYVMHTASPFPMGVPKDRNALVPTAKGGSLRVVAAAERAGVQRVILTSSVAAVYYGHERRLDPRYTEADVSNVESASISAYAVSKTLAELAAWDALADSKTELATVNPALVLGPLMDARAGSSVGLLLMMMQGRMPFVPDIKLGIVDVRDVAEAHLRAMLVPEAAGRRFLLSGGSRSLREVASVVAEAFPVYRGRLPKATLPDFLVRAAARFMPMAASAAPELGIAKIVDTTPAEQLLGLRLRSPEEAIRATAGDLIGLDLLRRRGRRPV